MEINCNVKGKRHFVTFDIRGKGAVEPCLIIKPGPWTSGTPTLSPPSRPTIKLPMLSVPSYIIIIKMFQVPVSND